MRKRSSTPRHWYANAVNTSAEKKIRKQRSLQVDVRNDVSNALKILQHKIMSIVMRRLSNALALIVIILVIKKSDLCVTVVRFC